MWDVILTILVGFGLLYCGFRLGINESVRILSDKYIAERSAKTSTMLLMELADKGIVDPEAITEYYKQKNQESANVKEESEKL